VAIVAHHRITTTPKKGTKSRAGMSPEDAAAHFAKTQAIQKIKKKKARERAVDV